MLNDWAVFQLSFVRTASPVKFGVEAQGALTPEA